MDAVAAQRTAMNFTERALGFSITIPAHWQYMPPAWSPSAILRRREDFNWMAQASLPFCAARALHASDAHAYPTLQVCARPCLQPTNIAARELLQSMSRQMVDRFDAIVEEATSDAIVSGHRSLRLQTRYTLELERSADTITLGVRALSTVVFARGVGYTIALSGSDDPAYLAAADIDAILASVRIRHAPGGSSRRA